MSASGRWVETTIAFAALAAGVYLGWHRLRPVATTPTPAAPATSPAGPPLSEPAPEPTPPPEWRAAPPPVAVQAVPDSGAISRIDVAAAQSLATRINAREPLFAADLNLAEDLHARYPSEERLLGLLEGTLLRLAEQAAARRQHPEAIARLRRAIELRPGTATTRQALVTLLLDTSDWSGAESAAREALGLFPRDADLLEAYAYALFRQDRNREAIEAFRAALEVADRPLARGYLERLTKNAQDEGGMTEQRLARFHVRYDGDAHDDVGREILRALERHYATLASALAHQLREPVPVILFSNEAYFDAAGAPRWSGGVFDHTDGRIRVPIQGLTRDLPSYMDGTLLHELTHAFLFDIGGPGVPREVHEGLAQWMEGKRFEALLDAEQRRALADGRLGGVAGFYLAALAYVEHLMSLRGAGGINDLLRAIGSDGDVDAAFRQVYGHDWRASREDFVRGLHRRYGS